MLPLTRKLPLAVSRPRIRCLHEISRTRALLQPRSSRAHQCPGGKNAAPFSSGAAPQQWRMNNFRPHQQRSLYSTHASSSCSPTTQFFTATRWQSRTLPRRLGSSTPVRTLRTIQEADARFKIGVRGGLYFFIELFLVPLPTPCLIFVVSMVFLHLSGDRVRLEKLQG